MPITIRPFNHIRPPIKISSFSELTSWLRTLVEGLRFVTRGKLECVVFVTLTANASSTVLVDERLSNQSAVDFDPVTANAAAEKAAGTLYVTEANRQKGSFTITHANNAQTDRSFLVTIIG